MFPGILNWFEATWPDSPKTQVAMFHTMFNVSITLLLVGFVRQLAWLARKIIPENPNEKANQKKLLYLNSGTYKTPAAAIPQARREISRMGEITLGNLKTAIGSLFEKDMEKAGTVLEVEETVDFLNNEITGWLVKMRGLGCSDSDIAKAGRMLHTVADIERIGDHAENIAEYALLLDRGIKLSPSALDELGRLSEETKRTVELALEIFRTTDKTLIDEINKLEEEVDRLAENCVDLHIERLKNEICDPYSGVIFTDMVIDLERCADHAINIAQSILK
jgi:phosphate:Na+ symporter